MRAIVSSLVEGSLNASRRTKLYGRVAGTRKVREEKCLPDCNSLASAFTMATMASHVHLSDYARLFALCILSVL